MSGTAITRHPLPRDETGYELRVHTSAAVRVRPSLEGWRVHNVGASTTTTKAYRNEADALAERIARLIAA